MPIYTRAGDRGKTSLFGGRRVLKSSPIIECCGSLDELSSFIGLTTTRLKKSDKNIKILDSIQTDLYQIMALIAGDKKIKINLEYKTKNFEKIINYFSYKLAPLNSFIIPGGTEASAWFHILRTVCRRSERRVSLCSLPSVLKYLNRLSDLFFIFARYYNRGSKTPRKDV